MYHNKYLKYKNKYLDLKRKLYGGANKYMLPSEIDTYTEKIMLNKNIIININSLLKNEELIKKFNEKIFVVKPQWTQDMFILLKKDDERFIIYTEDDNKNFVEQFGYKNEYIENEYIINREFKKNNKGGNFIASPIINNQSYILYFDGASDNLINKLSEYTNQKLIELNCSFKVCGERHIDECICFMPSTDINKKMDIIFYNIESIIINPEDMAYIFNIINIFYDYLNYNDIIDFNKINVDIKNNITHVQNILNNIGTNINNFIRNTKQKEYITNIYNKINSYVSAYNFYNNPNLTIDQKKMINNIIDLYEKIQSITNKNLDQIISHDLPSFTASDKSAPLSKSAPLYTSSLIQLELNKQLNTEINNLIISFNNDINMISLFDLYYKLCIEKNYNKVLELLNIDLFDDKFRNQFNKFIDYLQLLVNNKIILTSDIIFFDNLNNIFKMIDTFVFIRENSINNSNKIMFNNNIDEFKVFINNLFFNKLKKERENNVAKIKREMGEGNINIIDMNINLLCNINDSSIKRSSIGYFKIIDIPITNRLYFKVTELDKPIVIFSSGLLQYSKYDEIINKYKDTHYVFKLDISDFYNNGIQSCESGGGVHCLIKNIY